MSNTKEIKGRDIYKIRPVAHLQNRPYDVEEGHPFHGQSYNTYTLDGKPFNVNSKDEFVQWRDKGILFSVNFKESTYEKEVDGEMKTLDSLIMLSCTNTQQELSMANTERLLKRIYNDAEATPVDDEVMNELLNG